MIDYTFSALNLTNEEVLSLNEDQALKRLDALIQEAYDIYNFGIEEYITRDKKRDHTRLLYFLAVAILQYCCIFLKT